ncbi:MAG: glycosyltransferase family 4 protein [Akkermansiaceae bacterium]|nr:glycosyltransferase family 4 protein [Armatimonadota bacterium]
MTPLYRFGFVLTTALGNATRTANLRKYADRHAASLGAECIWAEVSHWDEQANQNPRLPSAIRARQASARQMQPVLKQYGTLDAVVWHYHEPYALRTLWRRRGEKPLVAWAADAPPDTGNGSYPRYRSAPPQPLQQRARLAFDKHCFAGTDLFFPWSEWAAGVLSGECGVPQERMHILNVGIDLEKFPYVPDVTMPDPASDALPRLLFVGGEFVRKGGDTLLAMFGERFQGRATLDLVTKNAPPGLPTDVRVHAGVSPNDGKLQALLAGCDVFVLPTRADFSSYASMEAMATGRPVVTTNTGGVPDVVAHGETGFVVPVGDPGALGDAIETLLADANLRARFGQAGRVRVETHFSAETNARILLRTLVAATDAARAPGDGFRAGTTL